MSVFTWLKSLKQSEWFKLCIFIFLFIYFFIQLIVRIKRGQQDVLQYAEALSQNGFPKNKPRVIFIMFTSLVSPQVLSCPPLPPHTHGDTITSSSNTPPPLHLPLSFLFHRTEESSSLWLTAALRLFQDWEYTRGCSELLPNRSALITPSFHWQVRQQCSYLLCDICQKTKKQNKTKTRTHKTPLPLCFQHKSILERDKHVMPAQSCPRASFLPAAEVLTSSTRSARDFRTDAKEAEQQHFISNKTNNVKQKKIKHKGRMYSPCRVKELEMLDDA